MQTSFAMFLLATEENSLTKAAERANVTQQCLSAHILKLERDFGTKLFIRKPTLQLTPAGEMVARSLRQMEIIEKDLSNILGEIKDENQGHIFLGTSPTRSQILLPRTIHSYQDFYPKVKITCYTESTTICEELLQKGKIDLFLGINPVMNPSFEFIPLMHEPLYLIATYSLLTGASKGELKNWKEKLVNGADLRDFANIPFVQNMESSAITQIIRRHADNLRVKLNTAYVVSTHIPQIQICGMSLAAAFCPFMILQNVYQYNQIHADQEQIQIFPIKSLNEHLRLDIVLNKNTHQPRYLTKFIEIMASEVQAFANATGPLT